MKTSMKLSIAMIAEEFRDLIVETSFHQYDRLLLIERYKFYDGDLKLHSDTLYILNKSSLSSLAFLSIEEGTSLIFLGDKEEFNCPEHAAYFCLSSATISLEFFVNKLSAVFEKYRHFDHAMKETIFSDTDMQALVKIATGLFDNEITIRNNEYRHIAHSYKTLRYADASLLDTSGYTFVDEIQDLKTNPEYRESLCTENAWLYPYKDHYMLCFDIFVHNVFIYRVKLIDVNHAFRPYDTALFLYFVNIVKEKYMHMQNNCADDVTQLQKIFFSLLDPDTFVEELDMQFFMKTLNLNSTDHYLMVCMQSGKNTGSITAYSYYSMLLNQSLNFACSFIHKDKLAVLIKLDTDWQQKDSVPKKLTEFIRDENFRAGISFPFQDLFKLSIYYQQAQIALHLGITYTPFIWVYFFKDYRYHYFYSLLSEKFPRGKYLVPELHDLITWDKKNNTEYLKILRLYIKNNRNITQTAKELSIHRSTLLYRLEKISAITHVNIENSDMLHLYFLFLKFAEYNSDYF